VSRVIVAAGKPISHRPTATAAIENLVARGGARAVGQVRRLVPP
jgi:hypothetical protein